MSDATARGDILLAWSSGKDCALTLHELRQAGDYHVVGLLTTLTEGYDRVSMHGVREALLDRQADSTGLPLTKVRIPRDASLDEYERRMGTALAPHIARGLSGVAFGDIFLESLRKDREAKLAGAGLRGVFPLWQRDTMELAQRFINLGFQAVITCVDTEALDGSFAGRAFDETFLRDLPDGVDPCGENGEFHSFVTDGPVFSQPITHRIGPTVLRDSRFCFCDLTLE